MFNLCNVKSPSLKKTTKGPYKDHPQHLELGNKWKPVIRSMVAVVRQVWNRSLSILYFVAKMSPLLYWGSGTAMPGSLIESSSIQIDNHIVAE